MATVEEDRHMTPDLKNEPNSVDANPNNDHLTSESVPDGKLENPESQHDNDLSNSEKQPNKVLHMSESQATSEVANVVTSPKQELAHSGEPPSNQSMNSDSLPDDHPGNSEAQPGNELAHSEALPTSQLVNPEDHLSAKILDEKIIPEAPPNYQQVHSEAPLSNGLANSEAQPINEAVTSETQTINEVVVSETLPSNETVLSETQPRNEMTLSEMQPANEIALSQVQPGNEVVMPETESVNEVAMAETQHGNDAIMPDAQPGNEAVMPETQPGNEGVMPETQHGNEAVMPETQPGNEGVMPETQHGNEAVMPETQSGNEGVMPETQHGNEAVMPETQSGNEAVMPETQPGNEGYVLTQPNNEVVMSETQPNSEGVMSETQGNSEVVMSETQPSNEVVMCETQTSGDVIMSEANSIRHPNDQFSHPETLPNSQFTDFRMIHESQMPLPESLPNSEPEPPQNSHPTETKPIHNNMVHFEALPGGHLAPSEPMSDHQLANPEMMSHDQLASSQMLSHFELSNNETLNNNQLAISESHYELVNSETPPSYEIIDASTQPNNEEHTPETQPNKRRKKKSIVWEHFTIETVSAGCRRACCKQCKQSFAYSTGSKVAGTSHLKRHIAKGTCPALLRNQQQNQLTPYTPRGRGSGGGTASDTPKRRYRSPSTPYMIFDQDRCRHEIAKMIIMHDYPLHMVEHPGFVAFVQNLQPQFNMVTFNTIQGDCVATYLSEKQNLMKYFEGLPGRFCLTLDMWTSNQSVGYVFISGHFVDSDWKLQKRILNVVMEPYPDSDTALSHAVAVCLSDWSLEGRLFSITSNQALNGVAPENLRPLLSVKNPLILNGQLVLGNCIARTLSSVANDLLESSHDLVKKIRNSVKYVKTSESHEEKFLELKQQLQVPSDRSLFIDDQAQWSTTYQMLVAASELKEVFCCLDTSDPDYKGAPTMQDWKLAETLCTYLKPIFDAANILTATNYPTAITFFHEVWKLQLDLARAVMSEDPFVSNLTKIMQEKIGKYWRDCSLVLAIAVVMDPRFKMKLVEFSFSKIYGDDAHAYIKIVDDGVHELFHEYVALPLPLTPAYAEEGNAGGHMKMEESPGGTLLSDSGLTDFDVYIMETSSQQMKSELDQYLEESLLPRVPDFDVLGWWKLNRVKYPTLSKMARDILCVPVSTVPGDSVFDTKSKEMDQYRSSLRPETVEALVCAKDWMQHGSAETSNAAVKMGF
ncbi:zinc finger BED domain-containing protein DAYSLEEPER-like isoform X2 [Prosopis cineraria]|nr:zinc finger BED domain-containing protein DAYSLEEPER-like isoform X2 [Prosopis cineraria]XP_054821216.1 zinc finger BED domain-containing protein DAYSLEEPER-like isoform X2 [Prosopis cineraria]XP_054821217.1 zinc finger BED domain-containing protein DAYSLEEPER-like isoform X2 [Prosopis cineraria]XP_054821218.1 zinc finger BED domain-containing protein DAYSLEEPER-like isoform X2 [Prosopis cineraria]XP_054821220.1 zinc finger BED domain-containing protein DAYSLEEPER-like isoform X2 [Prosopis c